MFSRQKLPVTDTIEAGRHLELPQISDSIIYEIIPELIPELKRHPPCKVGATELPRFSRFSDMGRAPT